MQNAAMAEQMRTDAFFLLFCRELYLHHNAITSLDGVEFPPSLK
jgi:hypothetical protein